MKLENGEKYPCTICENAGKNIDCLNCILGEFTYEDTCYTRECAYNCEDSCIINAYERCRARNTIADNRRKEGDIPCSTQQKS